MMGDVVGDITKENAMQFVNSIVNKLLDPENNFFAKIISSLEEIISTETAFAFISGMGWTIVETAENIVVSAAGAGLIKKISSLILDAVQMYNFINLNANIITNKIGWADIGTAIVFPRNIAS